jgi:HEAT repeat protein
VGTLSSALNDTNQVVRHAAAYALGEIGWEAAAAAPALVESLGDTDQGVRQSAENSLVRMSYAAAPALLSALLGSDASRQSAAGGVVRRHPELRAAVMPGLLEMAGAVAPERRLQAIRGLGAIGSSVRDVRERLSAAANDPDERVREAARKILEK